MARQSFAQFRSNTDGYGIDGVDNRSGRNDPAVAHKMYSAPRYQPIIDAMPVRPLSYHELRPFLGPHEDVRDDADRSLESAVRDAAADRHVGVHYNRSMDPTRRHEQMIARHVADNSAPDGELGGDMLLRGPGQYLNGIFGG